MSWVPVRMSAGLMQRFDRLLESQAHKWGVVERSKRSQVGSNAHLNLNINEMHAAPTDGGRNNVHEEETRKEHYHCRRAAAVQSSDTTLFRHSQTTLSKHSAFWECEYGFEEETVCEKVVQCRCE